MNENFGGYNETISKPLEKKESYFIATERIESFAMQREINRVKEVQENQKEALEDLLKNYPQEQFFVFIDGELEPFSSNSSGFGDYPHIKTKSSIEDKIASLNEALSENRIDKEVKRLDNLIMGAYKESPNMRLILMEIRSGLSGYGKIEGYDFYGEELQQLLLFLEKNDTGILTPQDYLDGVYNAFNFCRKSLSIEAKFIAGGIKDVTSSKLFLYGKDSSPVEKVLEDNIGEPLILDFSKSIPAGVAGGIDGTLDYFTAFVDVNVVPDEIYETTKDLFISLGEHWGEIKGELAKSIEGLPERAYISGYMLGLVLSALLVPLPTVWGAMALKLGQFLKGLNVPTATISKIEKAFNSSEAFLKEKMARALPNKVKEKVESVLPIVEATRKEGGKLARKAKDGLDKSISTYKSANRGDLKQLEASRKMFNIAENGAILASIFGDKIQGQIDNAVNTDFAMRIYEEQIINGNEFLIEEVELGAYKTSGELQYNFIRVKERFEEIREIMDKEVMPNREKVIKYNKLDNRFEIMKLKKQIKNSTEYDELTKLIFEKYIN
ncbi:MAG: hypothetical protein N4A38_03780 [Candidatus Gracilibacteria bacterium]|nr:hypothetical protein [Candidatus Gracilibacteria bacterium]